MTISPSSNEVLITGLPISSGGTVFGGVDVIIPLQVSSASEFYVKDTNGNLIKVDPVSATQLYAFASSLRELNHFYDVLNVQNDPYTYWQPLLTSVAWVFALQEVSHQVAALLPTVIELMLPEAKAVSAAAIVAVDSLTTATEVSNFA